MRHSTHQWFHQIIKTRQRSTNEPIPYNPLPQGGWVVGLKGKARVMGRRLLCVLTAKGKTPVKKELLTVSAPLNLKQLLTVGAFTLSIIRIFLLLCHTKEQLLSTFIKPCFSLSGSVYINTVSKGFKILEDKSDLQTLIVSRICGQKQH